MMGLGRMEGNSEANYALCSIVFRNQVVWVIIQTNHKKMMFFRTIVRSDHFFDLSLPIHTKEPVSSNGSMVRSRTCILF